MSRIQLREFLFHVDPIKHIVGSGDKRAFHIFISKGNVLGLLGPVEAPEGNATVNDAHFGNSADAPTRRRPSWIKHLISALSAR
jgi:hypothetical protein